jgi:hypothetical protein
MYFRMLLLLPLSRCLAAWHATAAVSVDRTLGGGGGRRDQSVHVEKGHCHLSIPKLEVLLDLNNIPDTKADLATLVRRVTRRPQKVCTLTMEDVASVTTWPLVSHTLRCRDMMS